MPIALGVLLLGAAIAALAYIAEKGAGATSSSSGSTGSAATSSSATSTLAPIPGDLQVSSPTDWATALLSALGMPNTPTNVANIVAWEQQEGGHWHNGALYNPLNTTQKPATGSSSTFQSVGVGSAPIRIYTSWSQGLQATVATLENGMYGGILNALQTGAPLSSFESAVSSSPWGTHF